MNGFYDIELMAEDQVNSLQCRQSELREAIYRNFDNVEMRTQLNEQYDRTVNELIAILGVNASCNEIDQDLFGFYSDLYKDDCGFRPKHFVSYAAAKRFIDQRRTET